MPKYKPVIDGKRTCYRCGVHKPVCDFYTAKELRSGYRARCIQCDKDVVNELHTNNLDRALKNLAIKNKTNGKHGSKRRRAFSENSCVTPGFLQKLWQQQAGKCAVTGVALTHIQGKGLRVWTNVTVDRINPDIGYVEENTRLVCRAVNYMKAAMTDEEMCRWATLILDGPLNKTPVLPGS